MVDVRDRADAEDCDECGNSRTPLGLPSDLRMACTKAICLCSIAAVWCQLTRGLRRMRKLADAARLAFRFADGLHKSDLPLLDSYCLVSVDALLHSTFWSWTYLIPFWL